MGKKGEATSVTRHFVSKNKETALGINCIKSVLLMVATAWEIKEAMPFFMLT